MNLKTEYQVLGVMSGTSLDGLDLAFCSFIKDAKWKYEIKKATTVKYPQYWRNKLSNLHKENKKVISIPIRVRLLQYYHLRQLVLCFL